MKKFFVMILCVSTFFIGLGALVEQAGAKYKSDARALELIGQSRIAVGGDANLRSVRSLTINGTSTHFFDKDGVQQSEPGTLEINMQLPGKFSKMLKIGNPGDGGGDVVKDVDVIVMRKNGGDAEFKTEGGGEPVKKVIVRKGDGTAEEMKGDGPHKIIIRKGGEGEANVWNTEDGNRIVIEKDAEFTPGGHFRQNEMLRTTMALLLTAPEGLDVSYKYLGEGNVDGNPSNIIEVSDGGSAFKLFLDKTTFLPQMISYEGMDHPHIVKIRTEDQKDMPKEGVFEMKMDPANIKMVEHQVRFSDFRSVGGLLLPFRWAETVGGKQAQNTDITGYEVNPANIADKFKDQNGGGGQRVFVRKTQ